MLKGFKEFIARGNVIELAVGVIIGAAFKNIVDALVDGIINPLIAAVIGKPDFSDAFILTLNGTDVKFRPADYRRHQLHPHDLRDLLLHSWCP